MDVYRGIIGGALAFILLALYVGLAGYLVKDVRDCGSTTTCEQVNEENNRSEFLTAIGGLISALVIAKLAVSDPKDNPGTFATLEHNKKTQTFAQVVVWAYLSAWIVVGLVALIYGTLMHPELSQTLNNIGTAWFGLAVASGYAYFQLTPQGGDD